MPSGKGNDETPLKKGKLNGKDGSETPSNSGAKKTGHRSGDGKSIRKSVRTGGASPTPKAKPPAVLETGGSVSPVTPCGYGGSGQPTKERAATALAPTPSITSPQLPPTPPPARAAPASTGATPPPAAAAESSGAHNASCGPCPLQRCASSRHGAFVRVIDYAVTAEQGIRRTMEDQHVMLSEGIPFFGVYDGHGGTQCAEYLRDNLHSLILGHPEIRTNPEKAITDSIVKADADFLQRSEEESNESGSVCAVALILDDTLVVGNVGDTEAVLCRNGSPIVLTVKHNLQCNPSEVERVREAGGRVFHNRVGHPKFNPSVVSLAVTRAIGDAGFKLDEYTDGKRSGIIAVPDTKSIKLTPEDEFLVIGCDGLWDVMSYEEVVDFCGRRFRSGEVAQSITGEVAQAALNRGGTDNVTAMLIHLTRRSDGASGEVFPEIAVSTSARNMSEEP